MITLTQPPVSTVLEQLFADADASRALMHRQMAALSSAERDALMASARSEDYQGFYRRAKEFHLAVSRQTGALLYMYARMTKAHSIVEFGTSFGVSTLHLAAALRDNGGGLLITTEFEPSKVAAARRTIAAAGLGDLVEVREGDALETSCLMERRRCTRRFARCSNRACAQAPCSWPTTPTGARSTWKSCVRAADTSRKAWRTM
jgi:hypothetical protein